MESSALQHCSYIYAPPKRRWLPLLTAFGVGAACALAAFALPSTRSDVTPTVRIYTPPNVSSPPNNTFLAVAEPQPAQPPAKLQEGHPLIGADQPTISPSLKIIAEPIEIAQSRRLVTKERVTKNRHAARKSRRHERDDAYARYYDPRRNSYYGGYGSSYWR